MFAACLPRPQPAEPVQPQPAASPQPAAAPQPLQPTTLPQQPYPQPPYPQQPYPQQPYPQQPYYPQAYPPPYPATTGVTVGETRSHFHDGEVIGDFAAVGALAAIDILVRQDVSNGSAATLILMTGLVGGGAAGWMLASKYPIDSGSAHATTLGLMLGAANGALLIEPSGWDHGQSVLGLLLLGSAVGVGGGFAYGQGAHLTSGQATFVGNVTLLGIATAGLGALTGNRDGRFGSAENSTLAIGLDGGAIAGAVIAPSLDWSAHRAQIVFASTTIGALLGGMVSGLIAKPNSGVSDTNSQLVATTMTAGMWGGFGLGILMTKDSPPDSRFAPKATTSTTASTSTSLAPWIGNRGQYGVMAGGMF